MESPYVMLIDIGTIWVWCNFIFYLLAFGLALYFNLNFNTIMVGVIYLLPLIPMGMDPDNLPRFVLVSFQNTVFGVIELVIFVFTVRAKDATFDREHIKQLFGHTLPIAVALIGLSYVARSTTVPVGWGELCVILAVFFTGSVFRVLAVAQLGKEAFKFDIAFRENQKLMTAKLYSLIRHPSYTAMMIVILAYALTTDSLIAGAIGLVSAWFGFQYRIHHEEKALAHQFGEAYDQYRANTGMWLPRFGGGNRSG